MSEIRNKIIQLLEKLSGEGGNAQVETELPGVRLLKLEQSIPRRPLVYQSGLVIIAQGHKVGYLGDQVFHYDREHYLVLGMPIPFECETHASKDEPLLGLYIDFPLASVQRVVRQLQDYAGDMPFFDQTLLPGVAAVALDPQLRGSVLRLLDCLGNSRDCQLLGESLRDEVIYRVATGQKGAVLAALAEQQGPYSRLVGVINHIHSHYQDPLLVDELASKAHMSSSSFHRAFKQVTFESPLQYIKKIRLNKAKEMIEYESVRANMAALRVGYKSPAQFSRDFKGLFGIPPSQLKRGDDTFLGKDAEHTPNW
ncbi:AraC family transcriptional regulator [Dongshaea marina]|uniref:AraC family transcriptional regulator n=1 Tax=Dongshaea marina TaxID=2047966 RepID=UPI000D3EA305|nr:AraC family transcriptional regulator [Dongshaea marina]